MEIFHQETLRPEATIAKKSHFSSWINRDNPVVGNGEFESFGTKKRTIFSSGASLSAPSP
ncbi:hypothetical protein DPMN_088043 [Dreissena polymorpha]|uniref:Uncharacterized protein n=1 Tax=Dreissena polymorpha TaxID=45954 RepID=A0A9D4KTW6_DREPO|nr:hypothetical protein DPMN_088043 [Dreissena polymorpha]